MSRLTALALAVGVPAALVAARGIEAFLFGVRPNDPVTLVGSGALVAFVGLVASYLPARRAAGVNPLEVLRSE